MHTAALASPALRAGLTPHVADRLDGEGVADRVVSLPNWRRFEAQGAAEEGGCRQALLEALRVVLALGHGVRMLEPDHQAIVLVVGVSSLACEQALQAARDPRGSRKNRCRR